jgi:pimeloyl-ACP methyl ester carboxylesterase
MLLPVSFISFLLGILFQNHYSTMNQNNSTETIKYVHINDSTKIAYTESGAGAQTLLFIHGLGSNLKAWNKNIPELSENFKCIAVDLPGYGSSSTGDYPFDMQFFAATLHSFLTLKGIHKVHLVGHSMGGQIAITFALNYPDYVSSLVLIAPAGIETFDEKSSNWLKNMFTYQVLKSLSDVQIEKNFLINFYQMPDDARFMIRERFELKSTDAYDDYCKMIPKCVSGMLDQPVFDRLKEINHESLIIYGANDGLIPNKFLHPALSTRDIATLANNQIKNSELLLLEEAGHFVQWEKAKVINQKIKKFLTQK